MVIAVGNDWRGDDAAAWAALRALEDRLCARGAKVVAKSPGCTCVGTAHIRLHLHWMRPDATELLEAWRGKSWVVILDAAVGRSGAGKIHHWDDLARTNWGSAELSSHGLGLATALSLAQPLGCLPERLEVYAIVGRDFGFGRGLSAEVEEAAQSLATQLAERWLGKGAFDA
mgnify:FL=1